MNMQSKIEELTGIKKVEQDAIWLEVKTNSKRLEGCQRHDFSICLERYTKKPIENPTPAQRFGAKWRCSKCAGEIDGINKIWYERGLKHSESDQLLHDIASHDGWLRTDSTRELWTRLQAWKRDHPTK